MRVFINGFGRIGRSVLRALALSPDRWPGLEVVGINDIAAAELCAYLFEYDSVFGPWRGTATLDSGALVVNGLRVPLFRAPDLSTLDLTGVDLVLECTGRAETRDVAERGLRAGAGRVLISGPSSGADETVVLGANDAALRDQRIVSNASCTTNALAPLARLIQQNWGIVTGSMTTVHCYTGSQPSVDAPAADCQRSRAAALSMVPTTTSAARLLDGVLPDIAGRVVAQAVRVPVASVSCVDFHLMTKARPSVEEVNATFRGAGGVIGTTDRPLVSCDLRARPESVVMACPETKVTAGGMLRVFGWYDNEWGFSNRMLDMALRMG
ncbi:glyceraldehyde 3-phosphate dehydrogenase NAD-binding domain-containing protein [Tabrizicola sp.]|uniref:type I glyceraldehyde-3-phosphate dehydrogenase n=1 Tax=Tabrizicola sp. TaxID=2005166 RepID=UPI000BCC9858|nr:glyceraldehyde 3-phosphate dehydrogenase NAD-binding domain-containing protein [Tabrizicola sp.]MBY0350172.1 aldehyde dehydrogenase [Tabrizicola sp.]OYX18649.1 MAG: glyceraldehyde-3-phosphate dehydrogenase [Rhodobacterales bacterium 32-66-9]